VFGIGTHLDAVRSTRRHRVFCFGHCWVVLTVLVRVPFSRRTWALPVLFRLYRNARSARNMGLIIRRRQSSPAR
jgi:predicted metal-binding membrane protein